MPEKREKKLFILNLRVKSKIVNYAFLRETMKE